MASAFDAHAPAAGFKLCGAEKLAFVSDMFDRVAPTYDLLNHLISLGQTTLWRVFALSFLHDKLPPSASVLDVGCGTGWVSWYFGKRYKSKNLQLQGMDCSEVMLEEARSMVPNGVFAKGDVSSLDFDSNQFHMVTTVYTLRNFPDLEKGLRECWRVTKPGGCVVVLDAFPPSNWVVRGVLKIWLEWMMPAIAKLVMKTPDEKAYKYLASSIQNTVPPQIVAQVLRSCGAEQVRTTKYTFGTAARIIAVKPKQKERDR